MKTLYKTYPTGGFLPSLDNFCETHMYITWKSDNYNGNEKIFAQAEAFILGNPIEVDIGKYIPNEYIGKIKTMGLVKAYYNEEIKVFEYELDTMIQGEMNEQTDKRLKKALLNQHYNYHADKPFAWWAMPRDSLFIEVEKVNPGNKHVLYKQKELYNLAIAFDETGKIIEAGNSKRYFQLREGIYYDIQKEIFLKNGEEIFFSAFNSDIKKVFFKTLLEHYPSKVEKEVLLENMGLKDNKKLLDIKASLIRFEFEEYLGISKDIAETEVLIAKRGQGYRLNGKFFDKVPT